MGQTKTRASKPRSRTFSGCLTCRKRKVKCSLERPSCSNCARLRLECEGYDGGLSWLPNYTPGTEKEDEKRNGKWRTRSEMFSGKWAASPPNPFPYLRSFYLRASVLIRCEQIR
jgi:hypothetical protein